MKFKYSFCYVLYSTRASIWSSFYWQDGTLISLLLLLGTREYLVFNIEVHLKLHVTLITLSRDTITSSHVVSRDYRRRGGVWRVCRERGFAVVSERVSCSHDWILLTVTWRGERCSLSGVHHEETAVSPCRCSLTSGYLRYLGYLEIIGYLSLIQSYLFQRGVISFCFYFIIFLRILETLLFSCDIFFLFVDTMIGYLISVL